MDSRRGQRLVSGHPDMAGILTGPQGVWKKHRMRQAETHKVLSTQYNAENSQADYRDSIPLHYRLLFSLAIMGLFMEWLLPLLRSAMEPDTLRLLRILMLAAAALLLWGSLRLPNSLQLAVQFAMMFLTWFHICSGNEGLNWLGLYAAEIPGDAALLFSGQLSALSGDSRLLILVLGWGLLVCSVQQLALYRGSTALFTLVTLVYLLALDMGFSVRTTGDVIVALGLILWMQALNSLLRLKDRTGSASLPYARWGGLALAAALIITLSAWTGGQLYGARPDGPITLQPVMDKMQEWAAAERMKEPSGELRFQSGSTGYSSEDAELGSPLSPSSEAAFSVFANQPSYWRGESIAYYDGRRWIRDGAAFLPLSLTGLPVPAEEDQAGGAGGTRRHVQQRFQFAVPSSGGLPLFSAGTVADIESVMLTDGSRLGYVLANPQKNSFRLPEAGGSARVAEYTVDSVLPESDPAVLRASEGTDPLSVSNQYLQLPERMPARVAALAGRLTASAGTRYDAVYAVQDYLQNGFTYTLKTRVPPSGADFADDFLFVTKQGYCVHFATAMTVLLRSIGIPARYVQGYGPGTLAADSVPPRYDVTQGDAHAWVEVYFPGTGWVPFDPTPAAALAAAAGPAALPAAAGSAPQGSPASAALGADALSALPQAGGNPPAPAAAALLGLAAAWRWRRCLALLPAARRAGRVSRERQLRAAALAWRGLAARYGPPPPGVTAREYAASLAIEDARLRAALRQFIRQWEALAYSSPAAPAPPRLSVPADSPSRRAASVPADSPSRRAASVPADLPSRRAVSRAAMTSPPQELRRAAVSASSGKAETDAAAFVISCLAITFRLT
ncbi:transglutaminase domain-containing protein [Paenibacillus sp. S150]|uniref:transglutaminase TgpA family protein n=1 Tax=Paenibacillus sp. S150 TaxID=2749826 RepID=UPI001C575033|nr:transglutaminase domain-containing protein [Paenibacillus sp. S150]MBW4085025.1 transglutaminase domain-containing protein [Paenibacillus sp. S150]